MSQALFEKTAKYLHKYSGDPLGFVLTVFPWGEPGTVLERATGPDEWQRTVLMSIRDGLSWEDALRVAVSSGHGVGKSALVSWIILWSMATRVNTRGVVTANTDSQLKTKTWTELSKWYELAKVLHPMFDLTATALMARDEARRSQWRFDRITWSEENTEAFAGLHNQGRRIVVVYDEASAIPDIIWEVTEGALTDADTEILWLVCGNPTRSIGRFKECWTRHKKLWRQYTVDSRTVKITNKRQIELWRTTYGEDSDFFRVRVRGVFTRVGSMQFIADDVARASALRDPFVTIYDPLIFGVDVARFGDDRSVVAIRRGHDARSVPWIVLSGADTNTLTMRIMEEAQKLQPDAIFVDVGGVGAGVADRLRYLKRPVIDVQFGAKSDKAGTQTSSDADIAYFNKRAEMWGGMRDWLATGAIPNDIQLIDDLINIQYGYAMLYGQDCIQLEKKELMKKRGVPSPDFADALALTFAFPVAKTDHTQQLKRGSQHQHDYDPYSDSWNLQAMQG